MATLGEILRWFLYTASRTYYRIAARVMRRDRLLSGSERKFRALLESAPDAMVIVDARGHITLVNAQTERLFGYPREELIGQRVTELIPREARARHRQHEKTFMRDASVRVMGHDLQLRGRRKDGTEFPIEVSLSPLETDQGVVVMSAIRDVTEREATEAQLRTLAEHDVLTGLINRRRFEEQFEREIAMAARHGVEGALVLLDIDCLKDVNDTLGHAYGDDLLQRVAGQLRSRLRATDVIARLGGDEFAVILPHTAPADAHELAEQLLASIRSAIMVVGRRRVPVTCSAGIACFGEGALHEDVMLAADAALYAAKDLGRDRLVVHSPADAEVSERRVRASWTQRLRETLDVGCLVPYEQPILDTRSRTVAGCELLVRVLDDDGRPIAPSVFLPVAERSGMVVEIDRFMVECAIELIASAAASNGHAAPLSYAVNLSARSIADPELLGVVQELLASSSIDPALLVLEITETAAIENMDAARAFAEPLRALGCTFALDDFGAGFASFSHLKQLPLDHLKIDGAYIRDLATSPTDQVIVEHLAQIGARLGLSTTAEFVGDRRTLEMVAAYGVDRAQGFHIGPPVPVRENGHRVRTPAHLARADGC